MHRHTSIHITQEYSLVCWSGGCAIPVLTRLCISKPRNHFNGKQAPSSQWH
ncbi:UNVERIFIED_CONTAM: hypothetical protein FKN15_029154 [Acipenser sinensis]